jgi:carbonic anhydrase
MADIKKFITGFKRFQENYFGGDQELFGQLKQGQKPRETLIKSENCVCYSPCG